MPAKGRSFIAMGKSLQRVFIGGSMLMLLAACLDTESTETSNAAGASSDEDHSELLSTISSNVIIPTYRAFADETQVWRSVADPIDAYCQAIGSVDESDRLNTAQQSWLDAMAKWQQIEAFQFGPISDNSNSLKNKIYSWPNFISSCTIDQNVVRAESTFDITTAPLQATGLDALEYLLFNADLTHSCPSQIVETQTWDARTEQDRKEARCDYAKLVAAEINGQAEILFNEWDSAGNNFVQQLVGSGSDGGAYASQTEALNAVSDALFIMDDLIKDTKIAVPIALSSECSQTNCVESVESPYSDNSLENLRNNLVGFRNIFTGLPDGESRNFSFDDLLFINNFPEVSDAILARTDESIALIDSFTGSFSDEVNEIIDEVTTTSCINASANPDATTELKACQLHGKVKQITDELKGDFLTIISLSLPSRVEGDND